MEHIEENKPSPKYWMSLEQWRQDPEFIKMAEDEFRSSPLKTEDGNEGWARREFLRLMGASLALSSFGCVRRPAQKIIPYAKKPFDIVHGIPNYYASSYTDGIEAFAIVVTTRDGRPIKVEGNVDDPNTEGGMSARAHAHILKLYDPDRYTSAKHCLQNEKRTNREVVGVAWDDLDKTVGEQLKKGKVAVLTNTLVSPSTTAMVNEFVAGFGAKHYQYDDVSYEVAGEAPATYHLDRARYILSVNNDFLGTWLRPTTFNRQFSKGRKAGAEMNKLVVFESLLTLTGANADQRVRIRPSQTLDVLMALLHEIVVVRKQSKHSGDAGISRALTEYNTSIEANWKISEVVDELWKNRGQSVVMAGGLSSGTESSASIRAAANLLNSVLENEGKTVVSSSAKPSNNGMQQLLQALNSGAVETLIIHGSNPAYSLPPDAKFQESIGKASLVIYTGDRADETARLVDFVATDHNPMENWGDIQASGMISIQQPTIRPLYDTRAFQDSLLKWLQLAGKGSAKIKNATSWYEYLRGYWKDNFHKGGKSFEQFWVDILQAGVLPMAHAESGGHVGGSGALNGAKSLARKKGYELALYATVGLGDGALANVPWLQEFPDPVTKICWDNYASFSPTDAKQLKVKEGQKVQLSVGSTKLSVSAHIQPGQADGVVGLAIGYGRKGAGKVADDVGVNAYALAQWINGEKITAGIETDVSVLGEHNQLACVQDHHSMEGRQIVVEETLQDFVKSPGGTVHRHKMATMWDPHEYKGNKWGMVIDLNSCTGCGSCVIACQSENNIPTVGKKYVIQGREMHWIRIDRYYTGTPEEPGVVNQPLPCMHCDNAPCETVCPVAATVHSDEGTNDMIYNRCVGTRYCSNNCPYKVRRFNWFNYTGIEKPQNMALNPEVTQRFRGVMEKCTFCLHRIRYQKSHAKLEDRTLKDGDVITACQQSCPTHAITFGDLNDRSSAVAKEFDAPQSYVLLEELNTKPAVRYQVKVRNVAAIKGAAPHVQHKEGHV